METGYIAALFNRNVPDIRAGTADPQGTAGFYSSSVNLTILSTRQSLPVQRGIEIPVSHVKHTAVFDNHIINRSLSIYMSRTTVLQGQAFNIAAGLENNQLRSIISFTNYSFLTGCINCNIGQTTTGSRGFHTAFIFYGNIKRGTTGYALQKSIIVQYTATNGTDITDHTTIHRHIVQFAAIGNYTDSFTTAGIAGITLYNTTLFNIDGATGYNRITRGTA